MFSQPLLSIAMCTYNGAAYLKQQLDSIVTQTWKNLEIVIIDDCSTDSTPEILHQYAVADSRIIVHQNAANLGFVKNFEKAIQLCRGEFIALADQDDIWDMNKIELQAKALGDNLLIYHDSEFVDEHGQALNRNMSDIRNFYRGKDNRHFILENCVSGHSCLFKKELVQHLFPFPDNVFHDWWLAYIAASYGTIDFLPGRLVKYRQHTQASTDILRAGPSKKRDILTHIQKESDRVHTFASAVPYNQDVARFSQLLSSRLHQYFCFSLFLFMLRRKKILLFIQRKSPISKFNFLLKYLWGYKLKELLR
ncbi:MAG: epsH 2 [Sphingobacteriaceae bacterium]|jgi:glycosyltransferase involved in cell wall biosynthesis|nr:epsH 2 [Sphingobacteriaceae bacterium]